MMLDLFIKGLIIGLAIAVPVGPIGVCSRASTAKKRLLGEIANQIKKAMRAQKSLTVSTS